MGIADLWDVLRPAFSERVTFEKFVVDFIKKNGRTPRLAIDAYLLIFQSSPGQTLDVSQRDGITKRNFLSKLLYLVSLNVSFVIVFDGSFKPDKSRSMEEIKAFDVDSLEFGEIDESLYSRGDADLIKTIKKELTSLKIDFVQSPGEGEAECSHLQRLGIVDYVLTNDVDAFIFGATGVLRNFSRYLEDYLPSPTKKLEGLNKYYVTPVNITDIETKTGLDRQRLILLATLRGGDYSSGITRIGIKYATKLALCGSVKHSVSKNQRHPLPDLATDLLNCFLNPHSNDIFGNDTIRSADERKILLKKFLSDLNKVIRDRSKEVFGRKMNVNYELFIDEYYTLSYLFPRVNRTLFKFLPDSLSFGQLSSLEDDIKLPLDTISSKVEGSFKEVERTNSSRLIGYSRLEIASSGFLHTYSGESTKRDHLFIPSSYNLPLRHIIVKILSNVQNHNHVSDYISLTNDKEIDDYCLLMAKFDPSNLSRVISIETPEVMSENRLPSKSYVWLPRDLIKIVNPSALDLYDKVGRDERSPRKKRVTQTTTLDQFGQFPRSPTKRKSRNKSSSSSSKPAQLLLGDFFKIDQRSNDADFLIQSGNFLRSSVFQNEKFSNETPPKSPTKKRKAKVTSHNNEKESKRSQYLIQIDSDEDFTILESED